MGLGTPPFIVTPFIKMSNAFAFRPPNRADILVQLLYNGLYRYENTAYSPVPDLAAEPCAVAADQVTITCRLVETSFHNGTPLTADDVAFTYELARRSPPPECFGLGGCVSDMLESARAIDARTVEFRLKAPNALFFTLVLPSVFIDSRAVVEAAYEPLRQRAPSLDSAQFHGLSQQISDALFPPEDPSASAPPGPPDCDAFVTPADDLMKSAGLHPLPRDLFGDVAGAFNACHYIEAMAERLEDVGRSLDTTDLDAIALAYRALPFHEHPIGTGPFRFVSFEEGTRATFEAFDGYHFGRPATSKFEVRLIRQENGVPDGLRSGEIDWAILRPDEYVQVNDRAGLQFASYPAPVYNILAYNLRPGMLFADHALRAAVELCIDKPATVAAATGGNGDVIYSPTDPISWAFQPDLPHAQRDVGAARGMIEAAGWTTSSDGIYIRDDRRLSADVYVRSNDEQRTSFMDLVAAQVRDCGIEFNVIRADGEAVVRSVESWPHHLPGTNQQFQVLFIGLAHSYDPDDPMWASDQISSDENPNGLNFIGFDNDTVDQYLTEGVATYDQRERARIYRDLQRVLAEEQPALFAWGGRGQEAIDSRLRTTDGPLDLRTALWWWQLEKLVLSD